MKQHFIIQGGYRNYDEISFLKGFSIVTIVIMHLIQSNALSTIPQWIFKAASFGGTGVHIFFFCSGFGLWLSYSKKEQTWIEFIKKRFLKIYVPYIIIVVITFIWRSLINFDYDLIGALFSHVFLYKMFIPKYEESLGYFWFLSTLFQLYFVFVPMCKLKKKFGNKYFFIISLSISILWWILSSVTGIQNERIWGSFFLQYLWEFSLGILIADYFLHNEEKKIFNIALFASAVLGIGLEVVMAFSVHLKSFNDIPALIGFGSLALLLYQIKPFKKLIIFISKFSYEWYLVHGLVISIIFYFVSSDNSVLQILIGITAFLMSALIGYFYHFIIIRAKKRRVGNVVNK